MTVFALAVPLVSYAQDGPGEAGMVSSQPDRRMLTIVPRVIITEILTDNATLSANSKQFELITELSPGIRVTSDFGRVKGYFDYSLSGRASTRSNANNGLQNSLTTFGSVEAVDSFAFLDFNATVSQQTISGLGATAPGNYFANANQTESSTIRMSPYLRGNFAGLADFETRYSYLLNRNQTSSDVNIRDLSLLLKGRPSAGRLGWSLQASQQSASYSLGRTTESDSLLGSLSYAVFPKLVFAASAGQEANNYSTLARESSWTNGQGIQWTPSPNASFAASRQTRPFGQSHSVNFAYRTARTAWSFTDSQDVTNAPSQAGLASLGPIYDLYFAQFALIEPDPVKRALLVNTFLQANGINPNMVVVSNFLTSAVAVQRRQDMTFSLLGVRDTITFAATRTDTSRLDRISTAIDDLVNANSVRQTGLSISYAHRLTADMAMNVTALSQRSSDSSGLSETSTNSLNFGVTTRLGLRTSAAVSARRVVFDSPTSPYNETAVTGTVNFQF